MKINGNAISLHLFMFSVFLLRATPPWVAFFIFIIMIHQGKSHQTFYSCKDGCTIPQWFVILKKDRIKVSQATVGRRFHEQKLEDKTVGFKEVAGVIRSQGWNLPKGYSGKLKIFYWGVLWIGFQGQIWTFTKVMERICKWYKLYKLISETQRRSYHGFVLQDFFQQRLIDLHSCATLAAAQFTQFLETF